MRIRAVRDQAIRSLHHRPSDVGVQVQARDNRHARTDCTAHASEQLAFAVVQVLGHHCAVQIEVNTVDIAKLHESRHHLADDSFVGVARYARRG